MLVGCHAFFEKLENYNFGEGYVERHGLAFLVEAVVGENCLGYVNYGLSVVPGNERNIMRLLVAH